MIHRKTQKLIRSYVLRKMSRPRCIVHSCPRSWHARETMPLPLWTTCLNFNRSCQRLVQRYYLRLSRLCYQIPARWQYRRVVNPTILSPSFHQGTKERLSKEAYSKKNLKCLKKNLKNLRNDETIWWENFRLFFLHTRSCCDLLFFEEFYDVDFSVFSFIIRSLAEVTYGD